jgi:hypothetical protein
MTVTVVLAVLVRYGEFRALLRPNGQGTESDQSGGGGKAAAVVSAM